MIAFDRPWALVSLAIPLVVTLLALQARRAPRSSTGTLELWKQVPPEAARAPVRRSTPPLALLLLVAALCAACLALAGARARASLSPRWTVLLDRSPSMYAGAGGATALEAALELVSARLGPECEYRCVSGSFVSAPVATVPAAWLARPAGDWDEPQWGRLDAPGTVWVTDTEAAAPALASLALAGGDAGSAVAPSGRRGVFLDPRLEGTAFGELVLAWLEARGLERVDSGALAMFAVERAGAGPARDVRCDGSEWSLEGAALLLGALPDEPEEPWMQAADGANVVRFVPGRVEVAWEGRPSLRGDDVAFALEFSRRLDRVCALRADEPRIGPAELRLGEPPRPAQRARSYVPWLSTLAALLALGSLAARR